MTNKEIITNIKRLSDSNIEEIVAIKQTADCVTFKQFTVIKKTIDDSYFVEKFVYDNYKQSLELDIDSVYFIM